MAEFVPIDTSEDFSLTGPTLPEGVVNSITGFGQTEQTVQESVPAVDVQEYVHRFQDGTVTTYALAEAKKCPVASTMTEEQLKLILKFSALGMDSMMKEATPPKPAVPDQTKANPKTVQPERSRQVIEANRQVTFQPIADYELTETKTEQEDSRFPTVPAPIRLSKKVTLRPVPKATSRTVPRRSDRIELVSRSDAPAADPKDVREVTVSDTTETIDNPLPPDVKRDELPRRVTVVIEEELRAGMDSAEARIGSLEPDGNDAVDIDDVVWRDEAIPLPVVELAHEEPGDGESLQVFALDELRGIDEYLDELIALSVGEIQAMDVSLEDPLPIDLQQEIYYDAVAELALLPPVQLEERNLTGLVYHRADEAIAEGELPLDELVEEVIDLTDHGTHEAKLGVVQKWQPVRTLAGHLERVLGILSVYSAFMERA